MDVRRVVFARVKEEPVGTNTQQLGHAVLARAAAGSEVRMRAFTDTYLVEPGRQHG